MNKILRKKPGPKSTKQSKILFKRGTLGDATCSSSDENSTDDNLSDEPTLRTPEFGSSQRVQSNAATSEFRTPDPENDATDYGLEFTTSQIQNPSPRRCSTLRTAGSSQEEQSAEKNTRQSVNETVVQKLQKEQPSIVNDNETPTTSISTKSLAKSKPHRKATRPKPSKSKTVAKTKTTSTPAPQTSAVVTQPAKKSRKQRNPIQLEKRFWKEVLALQNHTGHLVPVLPFSRLVRELMLDSSTSITRITVTALEALQTASEMYLTQRLQDAYMLTLHRGRVTLQVEDMKLLNYLRNNS